MSENIVHIAESMANQCSQALDRQRLPSIAATADLPTSADQGPECSECLIAEPKGFRCGTGRRYSMTGTRSVIWKNSTFCWNLAMILIAPLGYPRCHPGACSRLLHDSATVICIDASNGTGNAIVPAVLMSHEELV